VARLAMFPGSFDPMTKGHLDVLRVSLALADRTFLAIGVHPRKTPVFSVEERLAMLREVIADEFAPETARIEVIHYNGLLIDAARAAGATILIRGLRDGTDFDSEMHLAEMNAVLAPDLPTVFMPAAAVHRHISATLVRQIAEMRGDLTPFVPAAIAKRFAARA
jgi:pantetheine-phosphate adenylyltransferase